MAETTRRHVILRLRRIEGQIRGLQRMIEEKQDCAEVIHQLSAVRKALDKVGFIILSHRMRECLDRKESAKGSDIALEEAMDLFLTLT